MTDNLIRLPEVKKRTGLSRSAIYDRMAKGTFPQSILIGEHARAVGWLESDIQQFIDGCVAKRDRLQEAV